MVIAISVASLPLPVKKAVWMSPGAISAHPQLRLLERLGTRVRAKLLVTDCDHLGDRLGDPGRHAGKIDGRGCRRAGY